MQVGTIYALMGAKIVLATTQHAAVFSQNQALFRRKQLSPWEKLVDVSRPVILPPGFTIMTHFTERLPVALIDELDWYINGLKTDLQAVKNGIASPYNNGLAEGSVNKIKLIKRIMYGRNSFALLKSKILFFPKPNQLKNPIVISPLIIYKKFTW